MQKGSFHGLQDTGRIESEASEAFARAVVDVLRARSCSSNYRVLCVRSCSSNNRVLDRHKDTRGILRFPHSTCTVMLLQLLPQGSQQCKRAVHVTTGSPWVYIKHHKLLVNIVLPSNMLYLCISFGSLWKDICGFTLDFREQGLVNLKQNS